MRRNASKHAKTKLLARVGLFERCSQRELAKIAAFTYDIEQEQGTVLTREGDPGDEFFIIVEGQARVTVGGQERPAMGPGSFFGELALLDGGPRTATVTLETPSLLLVLSRRELFDLLETTPRVAIKMLPVLGGRLRRAEEAAASLRAAIARGATPTDAT
jgi:CRP-like cAMP-binding protein